MPPKRLKPKTETSQLDCQFRVHCDQENWSRLLVMCTGKIICPNMRISRVPTSQRCFPRRAVAQHPELTHDPAGKLFLVVLVGMTPFSARIPDFSWAANYQVSQFFSGEIYNPLTSTRSSPTWIAGKSPSRDISMLDITQTYISKKGRSNNSLAFHRFPSPPKKRPSNHCSSAARCAWLKLCCNT